MAFRIMQLVDMGQLSLDQMVSWDPKTPSTAPVTALEAAWHVGTSATLDVRSQRLRDWMDAMITYSDNDSAKALLKLLSDRNDLPAMHAELAELGLGTLQINGIDPATAATGSPARST